MKAIYGLITLFLIAGAAGADDITFRFTEGPRVLATGSKSYRFRLHSPTAGLFIEFSIRGDTDAVSIYTRDTSTNADGNAEMTVTTSDVEGVCDLIASVTDGPKVYRTFSVRAPQQPDLEPDLEPGQGNVPQGNVPQGNVPQGNSVSQRQAYHYSTVDNTVVSISDETVPFTVHLKKGVNIVSIPAGAVGINNIADLLTYLGDSVHYAYGVGLMQGLDISEETAGFVVMHEAATVHYQIASVTEAEIHIREGYSTYGVPIDSPDLQTEGDLFRIHDGVWMVLADVNEGLRFAVRDSDEPIVGGRGYAIHSMSDAIVQLTGEAWSDKPPAAPPMIPRRLDLITTWGTLKNRQLWLK